MYVPPSPDRVESLAQQRAEDAVRHRRVLNEMIDVGAELTRLLLRQAAAQVEAAEPVGLPLVDVAVAYERISRAVRRSVMLVQRLGEAPAADAQAGARVAARRRIIRDVEDRIQREVDGAEADGLRAELAERLDGPELEDEIGERPVDEIIADICRDLGLGRLMPGVQAYARRRPEDLAALGALARKAVVGRRGDGVGLMLSG